MRGGDGSFVLILKDQREQRVVGALQLVLVGDRLEQLLAVFLGDAQEVDLQLRGLVLGVGRGEGDVFLLASEKARENLHLVADSVLVGDGDIVGAELVHAILPPLSFEMALLYSRRGRKSRGNPRRGAEISAQEKVL